MPGLFETSSRVCGVCTRQYAKYKCPRCALQYCSLACYKRHGADCTEGFYADNAQAALQAMMGCATLLKLGLASSKTWRSCANATPRWRRARRSTVHPRRCCGRDGRERKF